MRIELRSVVKRYAGVNALDRVSLEIAPGNVVALLGSNGAGKTTFLRCLAGIASPDQGQVLYDDAEFVREDVPMRRRLFFLPDFPFVFWHHTVLQHLGMTLRIYGKDQAGVEERVLQLLKDFEILELAERPLQTLSRGQLYKTALCGIIAADPELWLLDEPFASGMDPHGINMFKRHSREAANRGRIVIYSTQILDVVEKFSDVVCMLQRGEVRAFGSIEQLRLKAQGGGNLEEIFNTLRQEEG
ncbi:MAG: ABC transporter ATP-binding protein [Verrucomicrobiota bacterium]|nr:ABC transporter ATP-binding protein [Verrucomicrobiota bacterium]